MLGMNGV